MTREYVFDGSVELEKRHVKQDGDAVLVQQSDPVPQLDGAVEKSRHVVRKLD